jgi:hypothetical protein
MKNIGFGILLGIVGQIGSFFQLQAGIKFGWYPKYIWPLLLMSVPIGWLYLKSVQYFIDGFGGEIWPSRLIGFSLGIIVFTIVSWFLFREPLNIKTIISLLLGFSIVAIQVLWR